MIQNYSQILKNHFEDGVGKQREKIGLPQQDWRMKEEIKENDVRGTKLRSHAIVILTSLQQDPQQYDNH